jgi:hypothetical protein
VENGEGRYVRRGTFPSIDSLEKITAYEYPTEWGEVDDRTTDI